ncbi:MAG: hypothetical protein DCF27_09680 [Lysobacteraceae bacterium]|nr:MAG: hypothetical protein DCF27_09680 [Xanthomonadaceae bacterium]
MGAPFRWLMKAVDVGRRNPRALFGGFALLLAVGLVPSVVQLVSQFALADSPALMWSVYGLSMLASLVLLPPVMGAAIRLLHRCETGQPAAAFDLFDGYRDTAFALRMVLTVLLLMAIYLAVFVVLYLLLPGKEFFVEAMVRSMAAPPGGQPDMTGMPELDPSVLPTMLLWVLGMVVAVFALTHAYMLALTHAALGGHGPLAAVSAGFKAMVKNVFPLLGFTLAMMVVGFVLTLILVLVVALLATVLALVHPILAGVVILPIYLLAALAMYVVIFGFYYHGWREIFGEMAADPMDAISA